MSRSPRIEQRRSVGRSFTKYNYREAFPFLVEDFDGRCAYSMRHVETTGDVAMHIDHFDPRRKRQYRQAYTNLRLATSECNIAKGKHWPTEAERNAGTYFIDPCREMDYGVHIFEDPKTHELVGATPAGTYQILMCNLNAKHLILERRDRTILLRVLEGPGLLKAGFSEAKSAIAALRAQYSRKIPPIPALPSDKLEGPE